MVSKSCNAGHKAAQYCLGNNYINGVGITKNEGKAFEWFQKAALQGDALAQFSLGACYDKGQGVTEDKTLAIEWYQKAAEQGNADAQFNLAEYYANVVKDAQRSFTWFRRAAALGHVKSQYNLGLCYELGRGIDKDEALAMEWYQKSAAQNDANAQKALKSLETQRQPVARP
jgi:hypothetical protein